MTVLTTPAQLTPSTSYSCPINIDLLNLNLLPSPSLRLRNHNTQNPILQTSLDSILINPSRERKVPPKLPNTSLREPILRPLIRLHNIARFLSRCDSRGMLALVSLVVRRLFNGGFELFWLGAFFAVGFGSAAYGQGVGIRPFDVDVLLLQAWKFAVEFVAVFVLLDVELWPEEGGVRQIGQGAAGSFVVVV